MLNINQVAAVAAMQVLVSVLSFAAVLAIIHYVSWQAGLLASVLFLIVLRYKPIYVMIRTFPRDITAAIRYWRSGIVLSLISWQDKTVPALFHERVLKHPNRVMFIEAERQWTFKEVDEYTNRLANYFAAKGLKAGEDVTLVMENRADVVLFWLAMAKLGVATALINYNLRRSALYHCITAVDTRAIVFSPKMAPYVFEVRADLYEKLQPKFYAYGASDIMTEFPAEDILLTLEKVPTTLPNYKGSLENRLLYIYTSGTTGMPKASVIKHLRYIYLSIHIHYLMPLKESDILYICLPLYHMAGGILGTSQSVILGKTSVIVPKFSASNFWNDCIKYQCTVAQYIGETCRYLYTQPEKETDRQHSIRLMFGNGLRQQIWADFKARFSIPHMREIYGSTEGNANLINIDNTIGSVGFVPTICRHCPFLGPLLFNLEIIKVDLDTGALIRDKNGLCKRVGPNEAGEVVARIKRKALIRFDGYTDEAATSKKIYKDVFRRGDRCFSSSDILEYDELGYVFFRDRIGDTFRWHGENVSTAEVEGVISKYTGAQDCIVYGVEVPGVEGKAGMAALLDPEQKTDLNTLLLNMRVELPPYAIPLFIRLAKRIELTSTFKLKKIDLLKEGFDITVMTEPIYFLDRTVDTFVRVDADLYDKIVNMAIRL